MHCGGAAFPLEGHLKGEAMPKLTSKVTVKLEPGLLDHLQELADSEGLPVSSYIRKAMIEHVGIRQESENGQYLRIETTELEFRVINRLMKLGYLRSYQDLFHKAFDLYLKQEYDAVKRYAEKEFLDDHVLGYNDPSGQRRFDPTSISKGGYYSIEEDEHEGGS